MSYASTLSTWLNQPYFHLFGNPLSYAEFFGFSTGLLAVWLTIKKSIYNFPIGIANCLLLLFLFWESRLFADASLQIFFIVLSLQGWYQWSIAKSPTTIDITFLTSKVLFQTILASMALIGGLTCLLHYTKGSLPIFDATITALSVIAQILLNCKKVQSWYFWIAVDVISVPVYAYKKLYLIAILYSIFLGLAIMGLIHWRQLSQSNQRAHHAS